MQHINNVYHVIKSSEQKRATTAEESIVPKHVHPQVGLAKEQPIGKVVKWWIKGDTYWLGQPNIHIEAQMDMYESIG